MTITEGALLINSFATLVGVSGGLFLSARNSRKLDVVKENTDGLAQRNEGMAHAAGKAEGKADEKANPT
jgi:hypothetical protein